MPTVEKLNRHNAATLVAPAVASRLAAVLALLLAAPLPAHAVPLRLVWTLGFDYPPNPCIAGWSLVSRSLGLFASGRVGGDAPLIPDPAPPDLSSGTSASASAWFDADDGTTIFGVYSGAARCPSPGPSDEPVYAFPPGTAEGDPLVAIDPGAAHLVRLGAVCGSVFCPEPGPTDLPLFAFASPGTRIGTLTLAITAMPEPATWTLLLLGGGAWWAGGRRRPRTAVVARCAAARF